MTSTSWNIPHCFGCASAFQATAAKGLKRLPMNSSSSIVATHTSETAIKLEETGGETTRLWQIICISMKNWITLTKVIHAFQRGLLVKLPSYTDSCVLLDLIIFLLTKATAKHCSGEINNHRLFLDCTPLGKPDT